MDEAEYCGPLKELLGRKAMVKPDETYDLPLEKRTLKAQFNDMTLMHPETKVLIGLNWHTFPVTHFKLLVRV